MISTYGSYRVHLIGCWVNIKWRLKYKSFIFSQAIPYSSSTLTHHSIFLIYVVTTYVPVCSVISLVLLQSACLFWNRQKLKAFVNKWIDVAQAGMTNGPVSMKRMQTGGIVKHVLPRLYSARLCIIIFQQNRDRTIIQWQNNECMLDRRYWIVDCSTWE